MANQIIEQRALEMFKVIQPDAMVLYDDHGNLNDTFKHLCSCNTNEEMRGRANKQISRIVDIILQDTHNGITVTDATIREAAHSMMTAMLYLLCDWFPRKDCTLKGLGTLLSLAETRPGDPDFESPLDMMFKQVDDGIKYTSLDDGTWEWVPTTFRRNYDKASPAEPPMDASTMGMPAGTDRSNDAYRRFKQQAGFQLAKVIVFCQTSFLPFCEILGEQGADLDASIRENCREDIGALNDLIESARPSLVAEEVKRSVIGQDIWVDTLAKNLYQQLLCMRQRRAGQDNAPDCRVIVGMATTGMGKSFGVRKTAEALRIPFFTINAAGLTGAGYKGLNIGEALQPVCAYQQRNPGQPVLVFVDEVDKIRFDRWRSEGDSFNAQKDFLTLLDGGVQILPGDKRSDILELNTDDVLWVFAGAFTGIDEMVQNRLKQKHNGFGFANDGGIDPQALSVEELRSNVSMIDLVEWGFAEEFCGRLGTIVNITDLSKESFAEITRLHVNQYKNLMRPGVEFVVSDGVVDAIAEKGSSSGLGARFIDSLLGPLNADALAVCADEAHLAECAVVLSEDAEFAVEYRYDEAV